MPLERFFSGHVFLDANVSAEHCRRCCFPSVLLAKSRNKEDLSGGDATRQKSVLKHQSQSVGYGKHGVCLLQYSYILMDLRIQLNSFHFCVICVCSGQVSQLDFIIVSLVIKKMRD